MYPVCLVGFGSKVDAVNVSSEGHFAVNVSDMNKINS